QSVFGNGMARPVGPFGHPRRAASGKRALDDRGPVPELEDLFLFVVQHRAAEHVDAVAPLFPRSVGLDQGIAGIPDRAMKLPPTSFQPFDHGVVEKELFRRSNSWRSHVR